MIWDRVAAVRHLCSAAFCDNGAQIKWGACREALDLDMASGAPLPSSDDCDRLVMGDGSGQIPPALVKRYPAINALLISEMT